MTPTLTLTLSRSIWARIMAVLYSYEASLTADLQMLRTDARDRPMPEVGWRLRRMHVFYDERERLRWLRARLEGAVWLGLGSAPKGRSDGA